MNKQVGPLHAKTSDLAEAAFAENRQEVEVGDANDVLSTNGMLWTRRNPTNEVTFIQTSGLKNIQNVKGALETINTTDVGDEDVINKAKCN
jgi:hypothetical protein